MQRRRKLTSDGSATTDMQNKNSNLHSKTAPLQSKLDGKLLQSVEASLVIGITLRVLCYIYMQPFLLKRAELTSPQVSYRRLQDGIAMYRDEISPYQGDLFHFQPLLLRLFSFVDLSEKTTFAMYVLFDSLTALLLSVSARLYAEENGSADSQHVLRTVFKCYFLNPIPVASVAVLSLSVIHNLIIAGIVYFFCSGLIVPCIMLLCVSASLSIYPIIIVAPILIRFPYLQERLLTIGGLLLGFVIMLITSWVSNHMNWDFIDDTYGFILRVDDLTPNVGLVWYFFTQVFEHFRTFYLMVFQINLLVYVIPLLLGLRKDAHLHLVISLLLVAVFSSYPTLNDASVYMALLPMLEKYRKYPRYTLTVAGTIVTCVILMPVMWHMWIVAGSGNANFYFAVTLIYNVAQVYIMIDLMFAYFRKEVGEISASLFTSKTNFILH
ncbi:hypothetical protein V3C99_006324 [Haemonchus contortus]|uniref:GPI transamidase subunit PIG-U n=2 Tax=Haemonchus contortus TaxID=6289 RepID=A0A7I4XRC5_HAECO